MIEQQHVAYHEWSHAHMANLLGWEVKSLWYDPRSNSGEVTLGSVFATDKDGIRWFAAVMLAPLVIGDAPSAYDLETVSLLSEKGLGQSELEQANMIVLKHSVQLDSLAHKYEPYGAYICHNWPFAEARETSA